MNSYGGRSTGGNYRAPPRNNNRLGSSVQTDESLIAELKGKNYEEKMKVLNPDWEDWDQPAPIKPAVKISSPKAQASFPPKPAVNAQVENFSNSLQTPLSKPIPYIATTIPVSTPYVYPAPVFEPNQTPIPCVTPGQHLAQNSNFGQGFGQKEESYHPTETVYQTSNFNSTQSQIPLTNSTSQFNKFSPKSIPYRVSLDQQQHSIKPQIQEQNSTNKVHHGEWGSSGLSQQLQNHKLVNNYLEQSSKAYENKLPEDFQNQRQQVIIDNNAEVMNNASMETSDSNKAFTFGTAVPDSFKETCILAQQTWGLSKPLEALARIPDSNWNASSTPQACYGDQKQSETSTATIKPLVADFKHVSSNKELPKPIPWVSASKPTACGDHVSVSTFPQTTQASGHSVQADTSILVAKPVPVNKELPKPFSWSKSAASGDIPVSTFKQNIQKEPFQETEVPIHSNMSFQLQSSSGVESLSNVKHQNLPRSYPPRVGEEELISAFVDSQPVITNTISKTFNSSWNKTDKKSIELSDLTNEAQARALSDLNVLMMEPQLSTEKVVEWSNRIQNEFDANHNLVVHKGNFMENSESDNGLNKDSFSKKMPSSNLVNEKLTSSDFLRFSQIISLITENFVQLNHLISNIAQR